MILLSESIAKYCKFLFLNLTEVPHPVFASSGLWKKNGILEGEVKVTYVCVELFWWYFFQKNSNFCDFQRNLDNFQKRFLKKYTVKGKLEKL